MDIKQRRAHYTRIAENTLPLVEDILEKKISMPTVTSTSPSWKGEYYSARYVQMRDGGLICISEDEEFNYAQLHRLTSHELVHAAVAEYEKHDYAGIILEEGLCEAVSFKALEYLTSMTGEGVFLREARKKKIKHTIQNLSVLFRDEYSVGYSRVRKMEREGMSLPAIFESLPIYL